MCVLGWCRATVSEVKMMMMISYDGSGLGATSLTVPDLFMLEEEGGGRRSSGGVNIRQESNISIVYYVSMMGDIVATWGYSPVLTTPTSQIIKQGK